MYLNIRLQKKNLVNMENSTAMQYIPGEAMFHELGLSGQHHSR